MAPLPLSQRVWLQAMLAHGVVSQAHAKALQKRACEITRDEYQAGSLPILLEEVGKHLSSVGLEIRQARDEFTGAHLIMVVNAKGDELAQVATTHSATEIAVTKKILERIFTNNDAYSLSSTEALKIGRQCKPPLGNAETEMLLSALVKEGWLRYNRETGRYLLSSRSMMELNVYLKNAYPEHYFSCIMCEDPITNGVACSNVECKVRVHKHCQTSYERQIGISTREGQASACRGCQHTWSPSPVGEASVQSRPARRRRHSEDDNEEEDEEEIERRPSQRKRRRTRRAEDEEDEDVNSLQGRGTSPGTPVGDEEDASDQASQVDEDGDAE